MVSDNNQKLRKLEYEINYGRAKNKINLNCRKYENSIIRNI